MALELVACYFLPMSKRPVTVRILFALPLVVTLVWALLGAAQTNPFFAPLRAGQLTGMKVENSDGQKIGTLRNLVVDMRSGELKYAVIGSGGFLGVHATLKLAPARIMSAATTKRETLAINVTTERWEDAPVFKASKLASIAEPNRAWAISSYFGRPPVYATKVADHSLSTTGRTIEQQSRADPPVLKYASDLIGTRVVDQKGEKVGEIQDLLVSFGRPRPAFAIISTGRFLRRGREYAVPLSALQAMDGDRKLLLDADAGTFQRAPAFDQQAWESTGTNRFDRIYRYSKAED
jgi:sporulation protein YlmC with PRC-barrel domain